MWGRANVPPIFVFLPEPGKDAATQLEAAAIAELAQEYSAVAQREESRARQKAFCDRIRGSNKFVRTFATLAMLREQALASISLWNEEILRAALNRRPAAAVQGIPLVELGSIGREDPGNDIDDAYTAAMREKAVGVCFVVHGPEDGGQFQFHAYLEARNPWEINRPIRLITPAHDEFDVATLTAASLAAVAPDFVPPAPTIEALASVLLERSRHESVVMFLAVDRLTGGFDRFRTDFWTPLVKQARKQATAAAPAQPFVLVLDLPYEVAPPIPAGVTPIPVTAAWDPASMVLTPALGPLTEADIESWLRGHGLKRAESQAVAARVIGDGRPRGVYDRLNGDGVWFRLTQGK